KGETRRRSRDARIRSAPTGRPPSVGRRSGSARKKSSPRIYRLDRRRSRASQTSARTSAPVAPQPPPPPPPFAPPEAGGAGGGAASSSVIVMVALAGFPTA